MNTDPSLFKEFFAASNKLADTIVAKKPELLRLLEGYETYDAAEDEIERSIATLNGLTKEFKSISKPLHDLNISTFFPLNLPLYSLVLFGVAPSAFARNIYIRPPEVMQALLLKLWGVLEINNYFPNISLKITPRQIFVELYASDSEVIIFTGKYQNALAIHKQCPDSLLIYNGSGINPFILFEDADVDLAIQKAVEMRCFNSGQDCAGPDAFFVPTKIAQQFVEGLHVALGQIKVGDTHDAKVKIGPTIKTTYIKDLEDWLTMQTGYLKSGGKIDEKKHLVYPSLIQKKITEHSSDNFHEFFAPYFYVLEYQDLGSLTHMLTTTDFRERAMYASVFGNNKKIETELAKYVQVLKNKIVNDVERGNRPYGGFGTHANFLLYGQRKIVHPILISRDMHAMLKTSKRSPSGLIDQVHQKMPAIAVE